VLLTGTHEQNGSEKVSPTAEATNSTHVKTWTAAIESAQSAALQLAASMANRVELLSLSTVMRTTTARSPGNEASCTMNIEDAFNVKRDVAHKNKKQIQS
jgi:hypothetical protein